MNGIHRPASRAAALAGALVIGAMPAAAAPQSPAYKWLSVWSNTQGGVSTQFTAGRLFNPADPADLAAPTANVTVTYYQDACWGTTAASQSQAIPPGQHGSFLTLLAAYPDTLYGTGCLWIQSDAPIVPVNGRFEETVGDPAITTPSRMAQRTEFWRAGQPGHTGWVSHWEHSTPLGGPQYGGRFSGGYVLYTARQKSRTAPPVPPAHVTVTHFIGACDAAAVWKQEQFELGSGQFRGYDSFPVADALTGQGCVKVTSDQPVVAFNGAVYDTIYSPANGGTTKSAFATTFQPVAWSVPVAQ